MSDREWYIRIIRSVAVLKGVDPVVAIRQCAAESGFQADVVNKKSGAIGLFQLMPRTAKWLNVDPMDPVQNIVGGVEYLHRMMSSFHGDIRLALAAYNWGPGNVGDLLQNHEIDWEDHIPQETKDYLKRILDDPPQIA